MASKPMKRCSASLVIREMQIKNPNGNNKTEQKHNKKCWLGCGEIRIFTELL